jgi:hypothetical protein
MGVWIEEACQVHFVDSWASGSKKGPGWNLGNDKAGIEQITLVGCRALLNAQHGLNVVADNPHAYVNIIGGHYLSNGQQKPDHFYGINIEDKVSHVKIIGVDAYNAPRMNLSNTQRSGINVSPGCDYIIIESNDVHYE